MNFDEAKFLLEGCERRELRDHAFGDMEVSWYKGRKIMAEGYYGGAIPKIHVLNDISFEGDEALQLMECGKLVQAERNDTTGPDHFQLNSVRPDLTKEAVHKNIFESDED